MSFKDPRDLIELTSEIMKKAGYQALLRKDVIGIYSLLGQPEALGVLLTYLEKVPVQELQDFVTEAKGSENQFPGIAEREYQRYPIIIPLILSCAQSLDMSRDLACYLADWVILRRTAAKQPVLVLNPPTAIEWRRDVYRREPVDWKRRILSSRDLGDPAEMVAERLFWFSLDRGPGYNIVYNTTMPTFLFPSDARWPARPQPYRAGSVADVWTWLAPTWQPLASRGGTCRCGNLTRRTVCPTR
jgi:hypothetical protein